MPVLVERRRADDGPPLFASERRVGTAAFLDIALVNNMPDSALESTERQFIEVLAAASSDLHVRLTLYSLPEVPRAGAGRDYVQGSYLDVAALRANPPDGLIVTGTEPRAPSLRDEPYWTSLTRLIDWAEDNAIPSVWSCLAAHAAVLHIDGIERVSLKDKRFGLFECVRAADHPLARDLPRHTQVAHSRWNELPLDALAAHGYIILTRSSEGGVDAFVKERKSLALFFQGHPEYDARALLREYRRDVGRYLRAERESYPGMPRGYFDAPATAELAAFRVRALAGRRADLMAEFPTAAAGAGLTPRLTPDRDSPAARIYANWLSHLSAQKLRSPDIVSRRRQQAAGSLATEGAR